MTIMLASATHVFVSADQLPLWARVVIIGGPAAVAAVVVALVLARERRQRQRGRGTERV